MIHMGWRPGKSGIRATGRRNRVFTGGNSWADKGECSTHRNGRRIDFRRESSGQRRGQRFRRDREMVTQRRVRVGFSNLRLDSGNRGSGRPRLEQSWKIRAENKATRRARTFKAKGKPNNQNLDREISMMFNNLVEYVEHQEQKTDSELEGDYLEKYYTCVAESSNQKQGGLNDQDVERIGHESEMLWNEFEKEHQDFFDKPVTPIVKEDYEIELLDLYLFVQDRGGFRAVCRNQKWLEIATHMGLPKHLDIYLRINYMRYLDLIEYYHRNAKDKRELEDNDCLVNVEIVPDAAVVETTNGSPKFKKRRVQAIRDFPPMCGPDFGFANFTISGTKERAATPESEPEENYTYYDDHAILDTRMGETDLVGTAAVNETQTAGSFNNLEITGSEDGEDLFESLDDQSEESSIVSNCEVPRRKKLSKFDDEPEGESSTARNKEKAESISSDEDFIIILNQDWAVKTYNKPRLPVWWDKTVIVVMNEVRVSSPYLAESVTGGTPAANERVKKVLELERRRLQTRGGGQ
ncbi:hypothetical protein L1987_57681 [Smallanthus sonchifolius]|uniref:Uncharacterized protein n=1 Tax=Smallanthus sonchifolius TaxID=185202 RepID=A0ACB9DE73_9ASTR|nr:hypothetical protein L1987_57681 [Smallanthus sonchifolius]